ncbi:RHS repeat protein [Opitutaceae bacterium TAV1]|nr:RHS repeat protein [Opitutaceae bacterium TAV1]
MLASDSVSDVYLWYYDIEWQSLELDLVGDGYTIRDRYNYGLAPDAPLDESLDFDVTLSPAGDFALEWDGVAGIDYRVLAAASPSSEWKPYTDVLTSDIAIRFHVPVSADDAVTKVFHLEAAPSPAQAGDLFTPFEKSLLASGSFGQDRNDHALPGIGAREAYGYVSPAIMESALDASSPTVAATAAATYATGATETFTYDKRGWLTGITNGEAKSTLTYDAEGNILTSR